MALRNVHFFTLSQFLILSASLFSTHGQNELCSIDVSVQRNTQAEAVSAGSLEIKCPVKYCDKRPAIQWCKLSNDTDECSPLSDTDLMETLWEVRDETSGTLSLHFKRIAMNDSGFYRCRCEGGNGGCVSHSINVTVRDASSHETADKSWYEWFWPAIYISSGITAVIITTTVLTCLGFRCRRGSQNASTKTADEKQYDSVQMSDIGASLPDSSHHAQPKPRPRSHPTPVAAQRQGDCVYENGHRRESQPTSNVSSGDVVAPQRYLTNHVVAQPRMVEEEANPLVYASLNHQVKPRPHTRPMQATEESTEYAAIRIS